MEHYTVELQYGEWCIIDQQPGVRVTLAVGCPIGRGGAPAGQTYATHIVQKLNTVDSLRAERDAARAALVKIASCDDDHLAQARTLHYDMRGWARAALVPALTHAIVEAAKNDPRPFVEIYADVAQRERWVGLWGSLSIAERNAIVDAARKEAGR